MKIPRGQTLPIDLIVLVHNMQQASLARNMLFGDQENLLLHVRVFSKEQAVYTLVCQQWH